MDRQNDANQTYKDNRSELKRRLKAEYNLPEDAVIGAILDGAVMDINSGYAEMELIREKYPDLIYSWCGRLHFRAECQRQSEEYLARRNHDD